MNRRQSCGTTHTAGRCEACQTGVANSKHPTVSGVRVIPRRETRVIPRREASAKPRREVASPRQARRLLPWPVLLVLCTLIVTLIYIAALVLVIMPILGAGKEVPNGVTPGIICGLSIGLAQWVDPTLFQSEESA